MQMVKGDIDNPLECIFLEHEGNGRTVRARSQRGGDL
jgi:hypothetical protein